MSNKKYVLAKSYVVEHGVISFGHGHEGGDWVQGQSITASHLATVEPERVQELEEMGALRRVEEYPVPETEAEIAAKATAAKAAADADAKAAAKAAADAAKAAAAKAP